MLKFKRWWWQESLESQLRKMRDSYFVEEDNQIFAICFFMPPFESYFLDICLC